MRYKVKRGIEIRSENAAKPESQPSRFLVDLISELDPVDNTFDYGCGKLRYGKHILKTTNRLSIVDSEIQLSRKQMLQGKEISIRELLKGSNQISVFNTVEFEKVEAIYDRGFCINVLSVIPSYLHRRNVLESIRSSLRRGGECLFVVQYRNSEFTRMMKLPHAENYLDGFLINSLRGYSFYGMIAPCRLESFLRKAGFLIRNSILNEGSVYIWAINT